MRGLECATYFLELFYRFRWTVCCRFSWLLLALQVINSAWNRSSAIVTLDSFRSHVDLPSCNLIAPCRLRQISGHRVLHYSDAVVDIDMIDLYSSPTVPGTRWCCNICSFHSSRRCKPLHRKLCEFRISNTARIRFASDSIVVPKVLRKFGGGRLWLWVPLTRKAWFIANVRGGNGRKLERMRLGLIYNNDAAMYYLLLTLSTAGCWRVDCAKCRQNNWLAFLPHVVDAQLLCRNILSINITNSHWCTVELL